mmetsp:Transcript_12600/g.36239  ORF Transcript_12600/g.36239 Transcript_12600/m.36239 type:complete len:374 (+) Transcript_12600:92-1213(+)
MAPVGAAVVAQIGTGEKGRGVDSEGRRLLKQPRGVRICKSGALLVADYGNNCVLKFKPGDVKGSVVAGEEGKVLPDIDPMKDIDKPNSGPLTLPEEEGMLLKQPSDICEDGDGAFLVLDTEECSVQRFAGGKSVSKSIGDPAAVKNPRGVALAPDGAIVVCDTWSHRVLRYPPPNGPDAMEKPSVLAGEPNSWGAAASKLAFPSSVAFASDGALLVADTNNHRIQRFDMAAAGAGAEGVTVAGSSEGRQGSALSELDMPTGICVDPQDGSILVTDRGNGRLLRFPCDSRAGTAAVVIAGPEVLQRPWGVCIAPGCGAIYVSDERRGVVLRLDPGDESPALLLPPRPATVTPAEVDRPTPPEAQPPALGVLDLD